MYTDVHVKYLSGFGETWIFKFHENQSSGSWKSSMRTDTEKLAVALAILQTRLQESSSSSSKNYKSVTC
jgi:hypothetical protein